MDETSGTTLRGLSPRRRILFAVPSMAGLTVGALAYSAALTPSLLPRPLTFLLLLTAISAMVGYAIGTTVSWAVRKIPAVGRWHPARVIRFGIPALAWLVAFGFTPVAVAWQGDQQTALDMPATLPGTVTLIVMTVLISGALLLIARLVRIGTNKVASLIVRVPPIRRWVSGHQASRVHRSIAVVRTVVAICVIGLAFVGLRVGMAALVASYDTVNADTSGQEATNLGLNSGSADSLAPWDTLGREGRFYVSNTMTPATIGEITGKPAQTPTRVYVGMQQGDSPQARTDLALKELDRVGAWDRPYLAIYAVTGTGWVNPVGINSIEAVTGGAVTTVAVQYSAVPSWIGFVLDPQTSQDQNRNTVNAIVDAWKTKPADKRPELLLFGESLGSFGSQSAWDASDTASEVAADVSKIMWIGPPAESVLWSTWQADRTSGPAWQPVIEDGDIAKVFINPSELNTATPADGPAITFVAHPNDPVVYWSPDLLLSKPDWLVPPLGPGVAPEMQWYPVITYLQVGMDLISGGEPPEVGHNYTANIGPAVALTINPEGWTAENTARLQQALPSLTYVTG